MSLGPLVAEWIETMLVHGEGDYLGEQFELEDWQAEFVDRLYRFDPVTRRRVVRRALLIMPKGCGKTELTAAIGLFELAGPATLGEDGKGVERKAPNIPVAAASFEQADRLFGAAKVMAKEGNLAPFVEVYDTEILLKGRPGRMFRIAAEAGTNEGGLPTCFAADEIHEWAGRKARVHLVVSSSLAKRADGLELNITTPDDADPDSLLGRLRDYGERVASGEVDDPSFLYEVHTAASHWDLDDPAQLRRAIAEATPAGWLDRERIAARWEQDRIPEHEFRRYHLAQFVRPQGGWLPGGAWDECARPEAGEPADGATVVLGFDGSYSGDSTALIGCTLEGHLFAVGVWDNPGDDRWRVPREEVKAVVGDAVRRWKVAELAADPFGWHGEIEGWEDTYGDVVVRFETNQRKRMAEAASRFYTAVTAGTLTHDGDPRLARHVRNVVPKQTTSGVVLSKDHAESPRKIDAAVAAVVAYDRAAWHAANPKKVSVGIW